MDDVFEDDKLPEPVEPEKPKVKKKRKPLSDERKKQLREQLKKGRATSLAKRKAKAKVKKITKAKETLTELEPDEPNVEMKVSKIKNPDIDKHQIILDKLSAIEQRMIDKALRKAKVKEEKLKSKATPEPKPKPEPKATPEPRPKKQTIIPQPRKTIYQTTFKSRRKW